jgi:hypothetical protein
MEEPMAAMTTAATCGHSTWPRSPPTPLSSGAEVLSSGTEADVVDDAMIEAGTVYGKGLRTPVWHSV